MSKLKFGIVGWGTISDIHAQALVKADNCALTSIYTSSEEKKKIISQKYDAEVFTCYNTFLQSEIDIVSICTPSGTHLDYGIKAAQQGKHVIVEKPIEISSERAKELIKICEDNKVSLSVIFQNRYLESVREIKKAIDENLLGKIHHVSAYVKWWRSQEYYDSNQWRGTDKYDGGGVIINQAIHTIDLLIYLIGEVLQVSAFTGTFAHNIKVEDSAVAILKYTNGAIGIIEASTSVKPASLRRIEIHGEKGTVILNGDDAVFQIPGIRETKEVTKSHTGSDSPLAGFKIEPHIMQFEKIAEAILNNKEPDINGNEGIKSLIVVQAIYEAAKTGKIIKI